ncbi:MAG: carboxypeptidase-like regulatory domain-containing protein [Muribaculaceae bacterium]|nr:carboxypeptidase-like regulatory domain-containing protein [Muribaculaceae bacterium]
MELRDSITGETLPFATISSLENKKRRYITDEHGRVTLPEYLRFEPLESSYVGYGNKPFVVGITDSVFVVLMSPTEHELQEVTIKPKKQKYSKKNNPAVDFVNRLREDSKKYNPENEPYYSYDKYEKTLVALNNFTGRPDSGGFLAKKMGFLQDYVDTSSYTGARLLDLILKEKYSTKLFSQNPKAKKEVTQAYRSEGVDEVYDQENVKILLEDVIREIDVYDGSINILQNRFVSPLSSVGPDFYKYYLTDTVIVGDVQCVELTFVPHNAQSMGFNGKIYVPVGDTTMFVKKLTMRTPHDVNLNFLRNLYVNQSFIKDSLGNRHKTYDDVVVEMRVMPGTPEFYGRKTTAYQNFSYEPREDLKEFYHKLGDELSIQDSVGATAQFWDLKRMVPLTPAESRMGNFMTGARKVPLLYWGEKVIRILESGYVGTWKPSKIDLGPVNSLISYSSSQGVRFRIGGMTTAALNPHLFLKGFVAYATKTHDFRYSGTIEYSFPRKKRFASEWPRHGFYASYAYDQDLIGESYNYTSAYNIVLSLARKSNNLYTNRRIGQGGYVLELRNNFSIEAGLKYTEQLATKNIEFIKGTGQHLASYKQAVFNVSLRWAKGEKFIQGRSHRHNVNMDPWVIRLTQQFGPKGFLGSSYTTNITELAVEKRFWFSAFGYMDVLAKAGKVWSQVYFPSLLWPNANLSYTIQPESYSLLDPMEFANDTYASIDMTYFGNGILFNHIPGIKKLKIREVVTFKGLKGTITRKNIPKYNPELLEYPPDAFCQKMRPIPYMEIGAGIDNILSVLRVDYVWRLSYRDTPGVDRSGLRVSLHFTL